MDPDHITRGDDIWGFPKTTWKAVLNAKDRTSESYKEQMGYLISRYWKPIHRYIMINWKKSEQDSADLTQEFFSKLMEKDYLKPVSPEKGKFRTFVKVSLKHFLIDMKRKEYADKRGGGKQQVDIAVLKNSSIDASANPNPGDSFDKEWAKTIMSRAVIAMREKLKAQDKEIYFKVFELYDLDGSKSMTLQEVADELGIKLTDVKNYITLTRGMLKKLVRKEVSSYVADEAGVGEELNYLLSLRF